MDIGTGGERGGSTRGTCPHNQQGRGAVPHSHSHACLCCNRPDYEISYKISRISINRVSSDRLTVRFFIAICNQETLNFHSGPAAAVVPNGRGLNKSGCGQKFSCALRAQLYLMPPPTFNIFLAYAYVSGIIMCSIIL